jgi:hypothetical protein
MTPPDANVELPANRAFVLQFEVNCGTEVDRRDDARGRVEHVVSGRATRFRTLGELLLFMAAVLRETARDARDAR